MSASVSPLLRWKRSKWTVRGLATRFRSNQPAAPDRTARSTRARRGIGSKPREADDAMVMSIYNRGEAGKFRGSRETCARAGHRKARGPSATRAAAHRGLRRELDVDGRHVPGSSYPYRPADLGGANSRLRAACSRTPSRQIYQSTYAGTHRKCTTSWLQAEGMRLPLPWKPSHLKFGGSENEAVGHASLFPGTAHFRRPARPPHQSPEARASDGDARLAHAPAGLARARPRPRAARGGTWGVARLEAHQGHPGRVGRRRGEGAVDVCHLLPHPLQRRGEFSPDHGLKDLAPARQ